MSWLEGYELPLPTLYPCRTCGAMVLHRLWVPAKGKGQPGYFRALPELLTPVFGEGHVCGDARKEVQEPTAAG